MLGFGAIAEYAIAEHPIPVELTRIISVVLVAGDRAVFALVAGDRAGWTMRAGDQLGFELEAGDRGE
jgi:hypothetical protein